MAGFAPLIFFKTLHFELHKTPGFEVPDTNNHLKAVTVQIPTEFLEMIRRAYELFCHP